MDTKDHVTINEKAVKMKLDSSDWYGGCYTTETKKDNKGGKESKGCHHRGIFVVVRSNI